jgi:hypothetical protein
MIISVYPAWPVLTLDGNGVINVYFLSEGSGFGDGFPFVANYGMNVAGDGSGQGRDDTGRTYGISTYLYSPIRFGFPKGTLDDN